MLPITQGVTSGVAEPVTFLSDVEEPETKTLVDAMSVAPSGQQRGEINDVIASLKLAGVWDRCDLIYMLCAHDAQAARLNWKSPSNNALAVVNAPVFTANRGYAGDGVSALLTASYNNSLLTQNDAHISAFGINNSAAGFNDFSLTNVTPARRAGVRVRTGTVGGAIVTSTQSIGATPSTDPVPRMLAANRTLSTDYDIYSNGDFENNVVNTSASPVITNAHFLGDGVGGFSDRQMAGGTAGASLTAAQHAALYSAVARYLRARGAI